MSYPPPNNNGHPYNTGSQGQMPNYIPNGYRMDPVIMINGPSQHVAQPQTGYRPAYTPNAAMHYQQHHQLQQQQQQQLQQHQHQQQQQSLPVQTSNMYSMQMNQMPQMTQLHHMQLENQYAYAQQTMPQYQAPVAQRHQYHQQYPTYSSPQLSHQPSPHPTPISRPPSLPAAHTPPVATSHTPVTSASHTPSLTAAARPPSYSSPKTHTLSRPQSQSQLRSQPQPPPQPQSQPRLQAPQQQQQLQPQTQPPPQHRPLPAVLNPPPTPPPPPPEQKRPKSPQYPQTVNMRDLENHPPISKIKPQPAPIESNADQRLIVLSLSDEYLNQARAIAARTMLGRSSDDIQQYFKLIALSLACLEVFLKKFANGASPTLLASVYLRYTTLLNEETDNVHQVQETLSKGISLCERSKLDGYKYNMQHLLARSLADSSPRAALKQLDGFIKDAATWNHAPWVYVLRFLRVDLSLRLRTQADFRSAFQNLGAISELARKRGDSAVLCMSATLEAWTNIMQRGAEYVLDAQRAIATARAQQQVLQKLPKLGALVAILDLACSLDPYDSSQAGSKMAVLRDLLESEAFVAEYERNTEDVQLELRSRELDDTLKGPDGLVSRSPDGAITLSMTWISAYDINTLGFLLSACSMYSKNSSDGHKAENLLMEGIRMTNDSEQLKQTHPQLSLGRAQEQKRWRGILRVHMLAHLAFCQSDRSDWRRANDTLDRLQRVLPSNTPEDLAALCTYLSATVMHSSGELDQALETYYKLYTNFMPMPSRDASNITETISILSVIQILLIIRNPAHPQHQNSPQLLELLATYFHPNPTSILSHNPHLRSAHSLLQAVYSAITAGSLHMGGALDPAAPVITPTKNALNLSLKLAKEMNNSLLLTACLGYMHHMFYSGIVGDKGIQAARAVRLTAKEAGSAMWMAAGDGLLTEVYERNGMPGEVQRFREEGSLLAGKLPDLVRQHLE